MSNGYLHIFRPQTKGQERFFLRVNTQQPVTNIAKELDSLQKEFNLPSLNSSNSRHVIETLK